MAAKKGAKRGKKKVTVSIDAETLLKLSAALRALDTLAIGILWAVADPDDRRALLKKAGRKKR